jgi:hypothetical protein
LPIIDITLVICGEDATATFSQRRESRVAAAAVTPGWRRQNELEALM